ncbi:basic amino acid ABC transporter substrate-binding protein [Bacillus sp. 03113]|uniref:basic amino acid ABC transporter substrate-binding protein n=1 Tax=Bacillus sp. 03113 TaxID=2578211 RepID=UPI0015E8A4B9|nr:basic amino acid ABC transporter substrate-binding protein [Bacillus sp. 03113]
MKKFSILTLVLIFTLILSACGTSKNGSEDEANGGTESKKTLRVVTEATFAPFEYIDKGEIVGFDADLIKAATKEAGYKYELVHVGFEPMFVEIKDKTADIGIAAITMTDERKQTYDFSVPYFLSTLKILVPEGSNIKSAKDLANKIVAVQNGTTGQAAVEKLLGKNNKNIKKFENNNLAIMELLNGGANAVVADNTVVDEYVKNNPDKKLNVIEDKGNFVSEYYGLMFPKGSELKADFDKAINTLYENGTYAEIYTKWFKADADIENLKAHQ